VGHADCQWLLVGCHVEAGGYVIESASGTYVLKEVWEHLQVHEQDLHQPH